MRWRLVISPDVDPFLNMALDEVLLGSVQPRHPTLRLYSWSPPAISLGRFQRIAPERAAELKRKGFVLVRRITGGGAIVHENDLTYSIVLAGLDELGLAHHADLYDLAHQVFARALRRLGVDAQKRATEKGSGAFCLKGPKGAPHKRCLTPFLCSERKSPYDLTCVGRKMMGSAQRRRSVALVASNQWHGAILQHGSLPLEKTSLGEDVISVGEAAGRKVSFDEMAGLLQAELAATLQADLAVGEFTTQEWDHARRLVQDRYGRSKTIT
jgi:lipoate-protein ligase A